MSLTGVQAFLRDELLAFCREAPPEFNDHQRDVFCVFSGTGVGRLREFLNQQKAHAATEAAAASSSMGGDSELGDGEEHHMIDGSEGGPPVLHVNVSGNFAPGATPAVPTPASAVAAGTHMGWHGWQQQHAPHNAPAGVSNLSQSAPATTGPVFWNSPGAPTGLGLTNNQAGGAQHVTGMMGAAILDEVDEGDEAFGEGSEIMGEGD